METNREGTGRRYPERNFTGRRVLSGEMKKSHSLFFFALAGLFAMSLDARAQDAIPPKPPGSATLPATPAPATPPSSTSENSAPPAGGKGRGAEFVQMLKEKVGVTDEQIQKMKPIFGQEMEKMKGLKDNTTLTREQKMDKVREIVTGTMEELKPILTPGQIAKLKEEMEKRRAARQQKQQ
jgi:Spy/CpxP family protein refolding chaperone